MTASTVRKGDWIHTHTGREFWPLDPRPEDIDPADIAHALSMLCRYGGHVSRFYSVAEHCILMSKAVAPEHALWALLHDATEAYLVDIPRPIKRCLPDYRAAERRLMLAICERFDLSLVEPDEVTAADNRILVDETAALMATEPAWADRYRPALGVKVNAWGPRVAERHYITRLAELGV